MTIKITNIKHYPDRSRATDCISADFNIDGKKAFTLDNDGSGGAHRFYFEKGYSFSDVETLAGLSYNEAGFDYKLNQLIFKQLQKDELLSKSKNLLKRVIAIVKPSGNDERPGIVSFKQTYNESLDLSVFEKALSEKSIEGVILQRFPEELRLPVVSELLDGTIDDSEATANLTELLSSHDHLEPVRTAIDNLNLDQAVFSPK